MDLPQAKVPDFLMRRSGSEWVFFTRMLYSCLVDADFLDTETFMEGRARKSNKTSMEQLWNKLQSYISDWFPPKGELNRQRCKILERCIKEGEKQQPGLFSLTVPTEDGKTIASLAFALPHEKKWNAAGDLRHLVYVHHRTNGRDILFCGLPVGV